MDGSGPQVSGDDLILCAYGPCGGCRTDFASCESAAALRRIRMPAHKYLLSCGHSNVIGAFLADGPPIDKAIDVRPRGRVLVVDDDPVICDLVAAALTEHGFP